MKGVGKLSGGGRRFELSKSSVLLRVHAMMGDDQKERTRRKEAYSSHHQQ